MATTQKKGGSRAAQPGASKGGSRTASGRGSAKKATKPAAKSSAAGRSKQTVTGKNSTPAPKPIRREVGAIVCFVLALWLGFGYFDNSPAVAVVCGLVKGLIGYGFWLAPPALLFCTYVLALHRGRPVRLRVICTLLIPVLFGTLMHIFATDYLLDSQLFAQLWQTGREMASGGVLCGVLGVVSEQQLGPLGTCLLIFAIFPVLMGMFHIGIEDIVDYMQSHPRREYEYEPEEDEQEPAMPAHPVRGRAIDPAVEASRRTRRVQDIPLDDDAPARKAAPTPEPVAEPVKKGFFNSKPGVRTPDEVLTGGAAEPAVSAQSELLPLQVDTPAVPQETVPAQAEEEVPAKITKTEAAQAAKEVARDIQETMDQENKQPYQYPPLSLLNEGGGDNGMDATGELNANRQRLNDTIHSFGIEANIINTVRGPSVTRYELELDQGVRLNKLTNLADDIALALGATGVRIAPIPDKISVVGIEVPNKVVSPVSAHAVIGSSAFTDSRSKVSFAVGKDISGQCVIGNIAKLPHLLIAGTTGSGKSVCTNSIITSLLYKATPEEVRLIMVDPKMVELGIYNGIPHLLIPVVTDPKKAAGALQWAVTEMMKRYRTFSEVGTRNLEEYNKYAAKTDGVDKMPSIVVLIDELADLMLVAAKEVEESICRVAQMGRAAGMHLVIATQRPSADVITGLMKANIPSRIAFAVASAMESRIILDTMGAEKLVGKGDMLFAPLGGGKPTRVQGCFISDEEVARVVEFVKKSGTANYSEEVMHEIEQNAAQKEQSAKGVGGSAPGDAGEDEYDELIDSAIEVVLETGQASVSMLQRRLKLGYARAARLVDQMEEKGVVGPFEGSKPRQLLITKEQWREMQYHQSFDAGVAPAPTPETMPVEDEQPPFDVEDALETAQEDIL